MRILAITVRSTLMSPADAMVKDALDMCQSDAEVSQTLNEDRKKSKGGKKQRDVRYCAWRQTDLRKCSELTSGIGRVCLSQVPTPTASRTSNGMPVFKESTYSPERAKVRFDLTISLACSSEPPGPELEEFSLFIEDLGKLFDMAPENLHIFWHEGDSDLMGFNRNNAIYLNLCHYKAKRMFSALV